MNQIEFAAAIDGHLAGWAQVPTVIIEDNERADTDQLGEYMRFTMDGGTGFITRRTGILSVRGNYFRFPVFLRFTVHTPINTGKDRMNVILQSITDHWLNAQIDPSLFLDTVTTNRVGEQAPHYIYTVDIGGFRDERR